MLESDVEHHHGIRCIHVPESESGLGLFRPGGKFCSCRLECSKVSMLQWDCRDWQPSIELSLSWFVSASATWLECPSFPPFYTPLPNPSVVHLLYPCLCLPLQAKITTVRSNGKGLDNRTCAWPVNFSYEMLLFWSNIRHQTCSSIAQTTASKTPLKAELCKQLLPSDLYLA